MQSLVQAVKKTLRFGCSHSPAADSLSVPTHVPLFQHVFFKEQGDAVVVIGGGLIIGCGFDLRDRIAHGNAVSRRLQHGDIVGAVTEGGSMRGGNAQMPAELFYGIALGGGGGIDLDVIGQLEADGKLGEALLQLPQHPRADADIGHKAR